MVSKVLAMKAKPEPPAEDVLRAEAEAFLRARGMSCAEMEPLYERVHRELAAMWNETKPGGEHPTVRELARRIGKPQSSVTSALADLRGRGRAYPVGPRQKPVWIPIGEK